MIIATLVVRHDYDILECSIQHHLANGVTWFLVTEHLPDPRVSEILDRYSDHILERRRRDCTGHYQWQWVTEMAHAACKYSPDWIIHLDADELWENLECLKNCRTEVVFTRLWHNYLPYSVTDFRVQDAHFFEIPATRSWFGDGMAAHRKIAHRPLPHIGVSQGNHSTYTDHSKSESAIQVRHYPVRTYRQFENKVVAGTQALQELPTNISIQWRRWYQDYQQHLLPQTYRSLMATPENICDALIAGRLHTTRQFL